MFTEFDDYLNLEFLDDYWYDEGMSFAISLVQKFDEQSWNELAEQFTSRHHDWQLRCAEALDSAEHPTATRVLLELITSKDDDVVVAAADSLRSRSDIRLDATGLARLKQLSDRSSIPVTLVLKDLLQRLN